MINNGRGYKPTEDEEGEKLDLPTTSVINLVGTKGFMGRFPFRVPTLGDQLRIGAIVSQLCDGIPIESMPPAARVIAHATAYMQVLSNPPEGTSDIRPAWWHASEGGTKLYNSDPILEYYKEGVSYEDRFHGRDEEPSADSEDDGVKGAEAQASADEDRVEQPVPAPSQRRTIVSSDGKRTRRTASRKTGVS